MVITTRLTKQRAPSSRLSPYCRLELEGSYGCDRRYGHRGGPGRRDSLGACRDLHHQVGCLHSSCLSCTAWMRRGTAGLVGASELPACSNTRVWDRAIARFTSGSRASVNDANANLVFNMRRRKQEAALAAEFSQLAEERAQRQSDWDAVSNSSGAEAVSEATQMGRATKDAFAESEWRKVALLHPTTPPSA